MNKLAMHTYNRTDPKYSNRDWQRAYFNSPKHLSQDQRMAMADAAYQASLNTKSD